MTSLLSHVLSLDSQSTCFNCKRQSDSGIYTNGDPYGDRRKIGLPIALPRFYCWDCKDSYHEFSSRQKQETDAEFSRLGLCGFLEAWIGRCRNSSPCAKHTEKCWHPDCDNRAIANCSIAGSLVCGVPYCANHPHEDQKH